MKVLRNVPLHVGNFVAITFLSFLIGFALGWAVNGQRLYDFCLVASNGF